MTLPANYSFNDSFFPPDLRLSRTFSLGSERVRFDSGDGIATAGRSGAEIVAAALEEARGFVEAGAQLLDV